MIKKPATSRSPMSHSVIDHENPGTPDGARCPICQESMHPLYQIQRFNPALNIWKCNGCGLQKNLTVPDDLTSLYAEGYYTGQADFAYEDERNQEEANSIVWKARLRTIGKSNPPPGDFLDVGCSFGGFVAAASEAGYKARGLDLSEFSVSEGRKRGRDLIAGPVEPSVFSPESFDVLTLIEVMEHLPDPSLAAQSLFSWLKPGGLAVIQTANFDGLQARSEGSSYHYYLPGHLVYYSARNLQRLLRMAGFRGFKLHRPVDFPLRAKIQKMRQQAQPDKVSARRILRTSTYHLKGKIALVNFSLTSSMVLYAWK